MYKGKEPRRNGSGCLDMTAHDALENIERDEKRVKKLISIIHGICTISGYRVENRIILRDVESGREWR